MVFHITEYFVKNKNTKFSICSMYFRTDTYLGFYAAELEQVPMGYLYTYSFFVFLLFYISLFNCTEAFAADLKEIAADVNLKLSGGFNLSRQMQNSHQVKLLIKDLIDLHNDMIEYFNKTLLIFHSSFIMLQVNYVYSS